MDAGPSWLKEDSGSLRRRAWAPARRLPGQLPLPHELALRAPLAHAPVAQALERMVSAVCTDKQKALLAALAEGPLAPTRAIRVVSRQLDCAESSVWSALAKLKEFGLVSSLDGALRLTAEDGNG